MSTLSQNQCSNISTSDISKKYSKNFQVPTLDPFDLIVEFVHRCPYFELEILKFLHKIFLNGMELNYLIRILICTILD